MKAVRSIITMLVLLMTLTASGAQRFFNLTADEVRIDSVIPTVGFCMPLPEDYADSIYTAEILYPEFIDMAASDIQHYKAITSDELPLIPELSQTVVTTNKKAGLLFTLSPLVFRDGKYQFLVSYMLKVTSVPKPSMAKRSRASASGERYASSSVLRSGVWAKIRVSSTGIHELTDAVIRKAGFTDPSKVKIYGYGGNMIPEVLTDEYLREYDDLKELPTCNVNGRRFFWAEGPVSWSSQSVTTRTRNPYSNYGYYFLTQATDVPATVTEDEMYEMIKDHPMYNHSLYEVDDYAWYQGGRNLVESTLTPLGGTRTVTLPTPTNATEGKITVVVTTSANSSYTISLNDKIIGSPRTTLNTDYDKAGWMSSTYSVTNLQPQNTITIKSISGGDLRLDYAAITTAPAEVARPDFKGVFPVPEYVYGITNQNHHADTNVDMVIIIPTSQALLSQAQRLADHHRQHDGLSVRIVPADELYNEFSSGTPDVSAYRRYMKMMYDRAGASDAPRFLLLFGDCLWDNRLVTTAGSAMRADNILLCYESENSYSKTSCYVSDDFLGILDDNEALVTGSVAVGTPDIAVGRMPVTTPAQAKIMVDKTINYALNNNAGIWQNTIMFMGDDGNNNLHMKDVDEVAENTKKKYPGYNLRKVYWDAYKRVESATGMSFPEVTKVIKAQQNDGALIMDYAGHGGPTTISAEKVLQLYDFETFTNKNLPLWITASCEIMPFDGTDVNIGETALLNPNGGAVAFYGTTRTVYANFNKAINAAFMDYVLDSDKDGRPYTIGEAQMLAKTYLVKSGKDNTINKLQYSLLGDPALTLTRPNYSCVVDMIDGVPVSSTQKPTVKANGTMRVSGRVLNKGQLAEDFNGVVTLIVKDKMERVVCLMNDQNPKTMSDEPFVYSDYPNTLYNGSASVKNGQFDITYIMPRDISYSNEPGLITLFARNDAKTISAHGECKDFLIGGSENLPNDSIGPSIYAYLNNQSFVSGDNVNSTPFFVADMYDKDGLNASGAGIGHNMQLVIDNNPARTYSLNENFQFEFGSYTKGTTFYSIPALEPGMHRLKFRAWDILNNPTTVELMFNVVKGVEPVLYDVGVTANPARTETTFIVTHDHPSSPVDYIIDIMDMSGRVLHQIKNVANSTDNSIAVRWDLSTDGGATLQTGVYLYRVRISSDGSSEASKAKKLIIIRE